MTPEHDPAAHPPFDFVGGNIDDVLLHYNTSEKGLSDAEAKKRLDSAGSNEPAKKKRLAAPLYFLSKFKDPLVVILFVIAGFSLSFGQVLNALLVLSLAFVSVVLSFIQEYRAEKEAEALMEMVHTTATVIRQGKAREIRIRDVVPGDIVDLFAGDMVPADIRVISCKDLFINQSSLTGESFPVEKFAGALPLKTSSVSDMTNVCFMGSSVASGTGIAVVVKTGARTQFGELSERISAINIQTSFERGVQGFTWLMIRAMMVMVVCIFLINAIKRGDFIQSLLFSLGVAVGLTPEMLPMIVTVNLSRGALVMSKKEVIIKRLNSIQNFGAMDVLCTDKTGTLTLDHIILEKHCDVTGKTNEEVLRYAYINSFYQTGLKNILDKAILNFEKFTCRHFKKIDEIPFDFDRKIMSVVVEMEGVQTMISKGAPEEIYKNSASYELDGQVHEMHHGLSADLRREYDDLSRQGFRVLAIAYKKLHGEPPYTKKDETGLTLIGYVAFLDPPKPSAKRAIVSLNKLGIAVKVLTGDNELVAQKICGDVGLNAAGLLNGETIEKMTDVQLRSQVNAITVFARLAPLQKARVIKALQDTGHNVGYLGDGINDAAALKTSDVGISVNNAVDIAKETADMILLRKSLMVLHDGVVEGRRTFGNIIKYIKMGSSSNFGNMLSMTGGSLFLPFIPMLPIQILLNNFLYDISQLAIPSDDVDKEYLVSPRAWNISSIGRFMVAIGPISSIFDFITYWVMLNVFHAPERLFHTGWFIESLCTQALVIHIIRTSKVPFIESWPSPLLFISSIIIVIAGICIPFSAIGWQIGFVPPPASYFGFLFATIIAYLLLVQAVKTFFTKKFGID